MTEILKVALGVGDAAPTFTARTTHGAEVSLTDFRGAPVLLFFYPFAFTGICTGELHALRDRYAELTTTGARVLAISCDSVFALRVFAETERLPFEILSDFWPHGEIADAYGVFDKEAGCALRASFVLDADGRIAWSVVNQLGDAREMGEHLAVLNQLTPSSSTG
ncbi:MAG: peroxiredoxin [Propionibacteriaceae bacterium]